MSQDGDPSEGGCADPLVPGFQPPEPEAFLLFTSYVVGGILLQLPRRAQATLKRTRWQDQGASGHCLKTALASPPWRQRASPPSSDGVPLSRALFSGLCPLPLAQDRLSAGLCSSPGRSELHTPVLSASEFALAAPCMHVHAVTAHTRTREGHSYSWSRRAQAQEGHTCL